MIEPLVVLFEDPHCLAVVKPAGLLTQGTGAATMTAEPTLEALVRRYLSPDAPEATYLGTVHRLDRPVSGVIVWARTPRAARRLAGQFARRAAFKEYWAIVEGDVTAPGHDEVWEDWLAPTEVRGVVGRVAPDAPGARRAVTRVGGLTAARLPAGTAGLRLWPETGRTHQLRVQAAGRGRPILGDVTYGATRPFPCGIALHARVLTVEHPILRTRLTWTAPLPAAWSTAGIAAEPG